MFRMRASTGLIFAIFDLFVMGSFSEAAPEYKITNLPLRFEQNRGQAKSDVRYVGRLGGRTVLLSAQGISIGSRNGGSIGVRLLGSEKSPEVEGLVPAGVSNYFIGPQENWRTGIPNYERVQYRSVYPGVDLIFHSNGSRIEFDFAVAPHANPSRIELEFSGLSGLRLTEEGDLLLGDDLMIRKPELYQMQDGVRQPVSGSYALRRHNRVSFVIGAYDHGRPLIIDPVLNYSAIIGGS